MVHELKILPKYFNLVFWENFEIRLNDRNFQEDDEILFKEWDDEKHEFTGRECRRWIGYIYHDDAALCLLSEGIVVMTLKRSKPLKSVVYERFCMENIGNPFGG